jgi:hypothetical protein
MIEKAKNPSHATVPLRSVKNLRRNVYSFRTYVHIEQNWQCKLSTRGYQGKKKDILHMKINIEETKEPGRSLFKGKMCVFFWASDK